MVPKLTNEIDSKILLLILFLRLHITKPSIISETWVELINHYYLPPIDKCFNSDNLLNAIQRTKWIVNIIEITKIIDEELSLYRNTYRLKKGKLIHCFYAAGKGEVPWLQNTA